MQSVTLKGGDLVTGTVVSEDKDSVTIRENGQLRRLPLNDLRSSVGCRQLDWSCNHVIARSVSVSSIS